MLKKIIAVAGVAGTIGAATPAFADWYQPVPPPAYDGPVVVEPPVAYGYGPDWRWREREAWRRHEWWEHWRRWHHDGWGWHHGWHRW